LEESGAVLRAIELLNVLTIQTKTGDACPLRVKENLKAVSKQLKRIWVLSKEGRPRKIGVFGKPKRGKSTLLNAFLGADILPAGPAPRTHCAVEIHNTAGTENQPRASGTLIVHRTDGSVDPQRNVDKVHVHDTIDRCFKDLDVDRVEIWLDFSSGRIPKNSVLVDTPGAEPAFEDSSHEAEMGKHGTALNSDTHRALEMLEDTDVILFCMRADMIGNEAEAEFYRQYMEIRKPINVINFKDILSAADEDAILKEATDRYGLIRKNTVLVSAKSEIEAMNAEQSASKKSGFTELSARVNEQLNFLTPLEGLEQAVFRYNAIRSANYRYLESLEADVHNFMASLSNFNDGDRIRKTVERSEWYQRF
jgi:GTPase Era involved in 16S rRNA processing